MWLFRILVYYYSLKSTILAKLSNNDEGPDGIQSKHNLREHFNERSADAMVYAQQLESMHFDTWYKLHLIEKCHCGSGKKYGDCCYEE